MVSIIFLLSIHDAGEPRQILCNVIGHIWYFSSQNEEDRRIKAPSGSSKPQPKNIVHPQSKPRTGGAVAQAKAIGEGAAFITTIGDKNKIKNY